MHDGWDDKHGALGAAFAASLRGVMFDLSDEQTFLSVLVTAGLFLAVAWTWYLLRPPKRSAEEPPRLHESR